MVPEPSIFILLAGFGICFAFAKLFAIGNSTTKRTLIAIALLFLLLFGRTFSIMHFHDSGFGQFGPNFALAQNRVLFTSIALAIVYFAINGFTRLFDEKSST